MTFAEEHATIQRTVAEMRRQNVPVTPAGVERVVFNVDGARRRGPVLTTLQAGLARLGGVLQQLDAVVAARLPTAAQRRIAEVKHVLRQPGNERLIASVNLDTGEARAFLAPRTYVHDADTAPSGSPWPRDATGPVQEDAATELAALRSEEQRLQAILDNPATRPEERTQAGIRLSQVRVLIQQHEVATAGPTSTGMARVAEVKAELSRPEHRGRFIASVNLLTGETTAAVVPVPYTKLSPARRTELEQQAKALKVIVDDPRSNAVARTKARSGLEHITRMLQIDGRTGAPPADRSSGAPAGRKQ